MILEGENLTLRPPTQADAQQILEWENTSEVVSVSSHEGGLRLEDIQNYISSIMDVYLDRQLRWIITSNGHDIGTLDIFDVDFKAMTANVGILIAEKSKRRAGLGKEAIDLLVDYCRGVLDLSSLLADVRSDNQGSRSFFESLGFEKKEMIEDLIRYERNIALV